MSQIRTQCGREVAALLTEGYFNVHSGTSSRLSLLPLAEHAWIYISTLFLITKSCQILQK
jgi:hypothetical protein